MKKQKRKQSSILVIDDNPDALTTNFEIEVSDRAQTTVIHPQEIELEDLRNADLVLVDFLLEDWAERDSLSTISLQPTTGMALAAILREYVDESTTSKLTAFALHTAHLGDLQGRLPPETAQHVLANLNNLEWVFSKTDPDRYGQMVILANALKQLPDHWPNDQVNADKKVRELLGIGRNTLGNSRCWQDVIECRVPVNELATGGHGILFVRWLLHQVLPYPCFLWSEHWVAARLGISMHALNEVLSRDNNLSNDLKKMKYKGILSGFLGDRWWRAALEEYVWKMSGGSSANVGRLRCRLSERADIVLDPLNVNPAVVSFDSSLKPTDVFLSPTDAVVLRPDYWPAFADSMWMDIETVRNNEKLQNMVEYLDQHRVNQNKEGNR